MDLLLLGVWERVMGEKYLSLFAPESEAGGGGEMTRGLPGI